MKHLLQTMAVALVGSLYVTSAASAASTSSSVAGVADWPASFGSPHVELRSPQAPTTAAVSGTITYSRANAQDPCGRPTTLRLWDHPVTISGKPGAIEFAGTGIQYWDCGSGTQRVDFDIYGNLNAPNPGTGGLEYGLTPLGAGLRQRFSGSGASYVTFAWRNPGAWSPYIWFFSGQDTGTTLEYYAGASS